MVLYATHPGSNFYDKINSFDQFNNIFQPNYQKFVIFQNNQSQNKFNIGTQSNIIDPKLASLFAFAFNDYFKLTNDNTSNIKNKLHNYYEHAVSSQKELHAKLLIEQKEQHALQLKKEQELKTAKAIENAERKKDLAEFDKKMFGDKEYNKSTSGKLVGAYQVFQLLQACYEGRKEFAQQLVTLSEYEIYKSKIKEIETQLMSQNDNLNTDELWTKAESMNRNGHFRLGLENEVLILADLINSTFGVSH